MRLLFLFPTRRSAYRVVEKRVPSYPFRVQRRWRWLWFEFWLPAGDWMCPEIFDSPRSAQVWVNQLERIDAGGRIVEKLQ